MTCGVEMKGLLVALTILGSGCVADVCDPIGTYELTKSYGAGDCGLAGSDDFDLVVTERRGSYAFSLTSSDYVARLVGSAYLSEQEGVDCSLDLDITYDSLGGAAALQENIALNTRGLNVVGNGWVTLTYDDGTGCQQALTFDGIIR